MSAQPANYGYFEAVAGFYRARQGGLVALTRADWEVVDRWHSEGIPLEVVLRGMDLAFARVGAKGGRINGLGYCLRIVQQAVSQQHRRARIDSREVPDFNFDRVRRFLEVLACEVEASAAVGPGEAVAEHLSRCAAKLREVDSGTNLRTNEETLGQIETELVEALRQATADGVMAELCERIDRDLDPYRPTMTKPQMEQMERQLVRRHVLEYYRVPRLSFFLMSDD